MLIGPVIQQKKYYLIGMKACHIRDGAALVHCYFDWPESLTCNIVRFSCAKCLFYWWLEKQIEEGKEVSECYAADELERLQRYTYYCDYRFYFYYYYYMLNRKQTDFVSLSFTTISASGPNAGSYYTIFRIIHILIRAAIIHYSPGRETCSIIGKNTLYLCDSGAHYRFMKCTCAKQQSDK
jgi:hypothetical protein